MFVQNLNSEQQAVLLYLAKEVIKADGDLHQLQMGMLDILKQQSTPNIQEKPVDITNLVQLFDTNEAKCSLLLELIGVANANREYHANEKDLISQYAKNLNISQEKLEKLEIWVNKQLKLAEEAQQLLGTGE